MNPQLRILQDLEARLHCVEGYVEALVAQQRESLQRETQQARRIDELLGLNRLWQRHCERLMRAKETLLEAFGCAQLRERLAAGAPVPPIEDADPVRERREIQ